MEIDDEEEEEERARNSATACFNASLLLLLLLGWGIPSDGVVGTVGGVGASASVSECAVGVDGAGTCVGDG
jgi:hypothetical protein